MRVDQRKGEGVECQNKDRQQGFEHWSLTHLSSNEAQE